MSRNNNVIKIDSLCFDVSYMIVSQVKAYKTNHCSLQDLTNSEGLNQG